METFIICILLFAAACPFIAKSIVDEHGYADYKAQQEIKQEKERREIDRIKKQYYLEERRNSK